jgi:hypothetical protein
MALIAAVNVVGDIPAADPAIRAVKVSEKLPA